MSEIIRNHEEKRERLRGIVKQLHDGVSVDEARREFDRLIRTVSPEEIAELEQGLIAEGIPVEEVQRLCDVHVSVFKRALEKQRPGRVLPGHPVHTYRQENRAARRRVRALLRESRRADRGDSRFNAALEDLAKLEIHYRRKENQLFPFLERVGFTGPSKVMWGKHDEIRGLFAKTAKVAGAGNVAETRRETRSLALAIRRMIFMEERILFPTALRKLPERAWAEIRMGEPAIGYAWVEPGNLWDASLVLSGAGGATSRPAGEAQVAGAVPLDTGELLPQQINLMLKVLPLDLTFVDEHDRVRYYSEGRERIFPRSPGIIGRDVANCHPPKSVAVVERIIDAFRKREKEEAEFWFSMRGRFLHVRYFAVYDEKGEYRGTIEVSQDVTAIRELEGERRLLDWT